jgi:hypothetical protein
MRAYYDATRIDSVPSGVREAGQSEGWKAAADERLRRHFDYLQKCEAGGESWAMRVALVAAHQAFFVHDEEDVVLCLNMNDTFAPAADGEDVSEEELGAVYAAWQADPRWGTVKWVALKRGVRPMPRFVARMKEAGVWDESMEALPGPGADGVY